MTKCQNLQVEDLPKVCSELGIENIQFDWKDGGIPLESEEVAFKKLLYSTHERVC